MNMNRRGMGRGPPPGYRGGDQGYGEQGYNDGYCEPSYAYEDYSNHPYANVIAELQAEEAALVQNPAFKHSLKLVRQELEKIIKNQELEYVEVDEPFHKIKIVKKVLIPSIKNPKFNYVGKVLGPGGKTLQGLAKHFKAHFYVLGSGSTRNPHEEQEKLMSGDPQYAHFAEPTHVRVEVQADLVEGYQRIAGALEALSSILTPNREDPVSLEMTHIGQSQMAHKPDEEGGEGEEEDNTAYQEGDNGEMPASAGGKMKGSNNETKGDYQAAGRGRGGYRGRGGRGSGGRGRGNYNPY